MGHVSFRKIEKREYPEIAGIYNHYVLHSTATYHIGELSVESVINYFEIERQGTYSFSILVDEAMCGFCLIRPYSKKEGYEFTYEITIYLADDHTRKGIGTLALRHLEAVAKEHNVKTIIAGICAENKGSIRLFIKNKYKKCGFFKNMGFKFGRMLDNIYFQKVLG
jgi:L-amino acid N-acyltransferase YncA